MGIYPRRRHQQSATGMPNNVMVPAEAASWSQYWHQLRNQCVAHSTEPGNLVWLPAFDPSGGGELQQSLELNIPRDRFADRRTLLNQLDNFNRQADDRAVQGRRRL